MKLNLFKDIKKDKKFYRTLLLITTPIVIQNLIASSINMLDTVMIGNVGEKELAAVGIANQFYFLFSLTIFGVAAGCGVFIAQLWGKKDIKNIKSTLGIGLIAGTIVTSLFILVGMMFPEKIMSIFSRDAEVISLGKDYLIIASISYLFTMISFNYSAALRSVRDSLLPMWSSVGALVVNGILNYILIFGKLGFEPMGVKGAAIATLIARFIEISIVIFFIYREEHVLKAKAHELFSATKELYTGVMKVSTPIVLNDICFGLGTVTYAAIYGRIGTEAIAAIQICSTVFSLFLVVIYGLANSAVVIVGNEIGANRKENGILYANRISNLALQIGLILAGILILIAPLVVSIFKVSDIVKTDAKYILFVYGVLMIPRVYNLLMIVGIFRGGGENKYGSVVQAVTSWGIGIPLAFFAAHVLHLPVYIVVMFCGVEEIVKALLLLRRYKSYKWIRNIIKNI